MNNATTTHLILTGLEGHQPVTRTPLQEALAPHVDILATLWWCVFVLSLLTVLVTAWKYRQV